MRKSILITGIQGSGKTTISGILKSKGINAIDLETAPNLFVMVDKKTRQPVENHDNTNLEKIGTTDWICDKNKLQELIESQTDQIAFYCGSATNIEELIPLFEELVLLKISEKTMRKRLSTRPDSDFGGKQEVQDWVMTWKDWWENEMISEGAKVIDANQNLDQVIAEIIEMYKEFII